MTVVENIVHAIFFCRIRVETMIQGLACTSIPVENYTFMSGSGLTDYGDS